MTRNENYSTMAGEGIRNQRQDYVSDLIGRTGLMVIGESEWLESFRNFIKSESLIETKPSLEGLSPNFANGAGSIYYGTGIATPNHPSVGLPFDVLQMILLTEKMKREHGFKAVYHHIADTHAKTNEWADPDFINKRAGETKEILEAIASNLGLDNFNVVLSSSFDQSPEYKTILKKFDGSDKHDYVKHEMADMEWYRSRYDVNLKAGWIISSKDVKIGSDERLFDEEYKRINGDDKLSFIYTKPGRTFDAQRPKVSPYIQIPGENRIILDPNENAIEKIATFSNLGGKNTENTLAHLGQIVELYSSLFDDLDGQNSLPENIQFIINKVTKGIEGSAKPLQKSADQVVLETKEKVDPKKWFSALERLLTSERDLSQLPAEAQFKIIKDKSADNPEGLGPVNEIIEQLKNSKETGIPLKIKTGVDPTGAELHLGHAVGFLMMKRLRMMGHQIQFVIGDVTARVGGSPGADKERKIITPEEINKNVHNYFDQVASIMELRDQDDVEIFHNSEWFENMTVTDWLPILSRVNAVEMLKQKTFQDRIEKGLSVNMGEQMYALLMGYDSVKLNSDLEIGGADQLINFHYARDLMKMHGEKPQTFVTTELIPGIGGEAKNGREFIKMGKSNHNYISLTEKPEEIYAKTMSISDDLMWVWYRELTEVSEEDRQQLMDYVRSGEIHPIDAKKMLARVVTGTLNGYDDKVVARAEKIFGEKFGANKINMPDDIVEHSVTNSDRLLDVLSSITGESKSTIRKMQNGVSILVGDEYVPLSLDELLERKIEQDTIVRLGRKRYFKLALSK
jgi:tyrosyl-tRNA synthetase